MQGILSQIGEPKSWEDFLAARLLKGRFTWLSFQEADSFVAEERFVPLSRKVIREGAGIPAKMRINKMGSSRKRIVYCFPPEETKVLKLIAFLLYAYDSRLPGNCYSFRRTLSAHDAVRHLVQSLKGRDAWAYKLDIHDYFNSVSIPILIPILRDFLSDDPSLFRFFQRMLEDDRAWDKGTLVHENRGILAGTPTAPFLADVYLSEVDRYFADRNVLYARYSDDIILFAPDEATLLQHKATLLGFLEKYRLTVNPDKERIYRPDEAFEFLGFKCLHGRIDISEATKRKMKGKIRRKARALLRAKSKYGLDTETVMRRMIRHFNAKFFDDDASDKLTWSRWFFPMINQVDGLREIDRYLQDNIRFLSSGKHTKTNYRIRYDRLKDLGYKSLVHEYYRFKEVTHPLETIQRKK